MKLYFHHFDIYKKIYINNSQLIISPYLCDSFTELEFIDEICAKVKLGYGGEFLYTNDLILNDYSLIDDLKERDCFMIFTLSDFDYKKFYPYYYDSWDHKLKISDLIFLGWDIYNYGDGAIIDGIFPIRVEENIQNNIVNKEIIIINKEDVNKFGLLPNLTICKKYLDLNKNEVKIIVEDNIIDTNWKPLAIYCDKYTYYKLNNLIY